MNLRNLLLFFLVLSFLMIGTLKIASPNRQIITSDGMGYYIYLPQILVFSDWNGSRVYEYVPESHLRFLDGRLLDFNENSKLNKYPIGTALMILPFFLITEIINRSFFSYNINHFDSIYEISVVVAGIFYFLVGLSFLWLVLKKRFSIKVTFLTLLVVGLGTNLLHYSLLESSFSHIYSFVLFGIFLFLVDKFLENRNRFIYWAILGMTFGLVILIRQTNGIIILLLIWHLFLELRKYSLVVWFKKYLSYLVVFLIATLTVFSIQMIYWQIVTGNLLIFSYIGEKFNFLNPHLYHVLISPRKGLFFWTPILVLSLIGFFRMFRKKEILTLPTISILIIQLYLVSSWWAWSYGHSFGHRAFTEFLAIFVIPLTYFVEWLISIRTGKKTLFILFFAFIIACVFLNLFQLYQYWRGFIIPDGMSWSEYTKIFLKPCIDSIDFLKCSP